MRAWLVAFWLGLSCQGAALAQPLTADAPELAARGPYAVGFRTLEMVNPAQPDLVAGGLADRKLALAVWYPATLKPGQAQAIDYVAATPFTPTIDPASLPPTISVAGQASADAAPVTGQGFPLVVISHGYQNWATMFSYLGEALASKGYVVAAIEHRDIVPNSPAAQQISFASTVINRVRDQRFVMAQLQALSADPNAPLYNVYDPSRIALVGYSMGGFGALTTAGAGYDPQSPVMAQMPPGLMTGALAQADTALAVNPALKALVLFAPWGAQPPFSLWSDQELARIAMPTMIIGGDHDDISDYANGFAPLLKRLVAAPRYLLTYHEARHNVAVNPTPPALTGYFQFIERFDEPVWRKERLLAINVHMIAAFLDHHVKGDVAKAAYLQVPTANAGDGQWPLPQGAQVGDALANGEGASAGYWRGFQRRWALGVSLEYRSPQQD